MTRPTMHVPPLKAAIAALAVLCAVAALGVLGTASIDGRPISDPIGGTGAASLETGPLGR